MARHGRSFRDTVPDMRETFTKLHWGILGALLAAGACSGGGGGPTGAGGAAGSQTGGVSGGTAGGAAGVGGAGGSDAGGSGGSDVGGSDAGASDAHDAGGNGGAICGSGRASAGSDAGDAGGAADADADGGGDPFALARDQCARNWQIAFTAPAIDSTPPTRDLLRMRDGRIFLGGYVSNGKWAIASFAPGEAPKVVHEGP
ncbi:MAG: hypothetical protein JWM82_838, partial [Myxococcales bacterium]|nr:hypothetical protein [Myxococcales bacterium]